MASVLPTPEEYERYVPGPESPVWRYASDIRLYATAGYALLLQVAHPTVGAGVAQYSNFEEDPWGRLLRTLDYVHGSVYGGPQLAGEIGRRVREMHRHIKGHRPDGTRYHALEPHAYAWVHATLAHTFVEGHRRLGGGMSDETAAELWRDWLRVGRLIGVRERDLPADWSEFGAYFDEVVRTELVADPTVERVLTTLRRPKRPLPAIPRPLWTAFGGAAGRLLVTMTVGLAPPVLRERLGLTQTPAERTAFEVMAAASRAATPLMIAPLRVSGPAYVRQRRRALQRGDVADASRFQRAA